jgi:hypothetical protein
MVEKLWDFEDFSPNLGMLSATMNATKSAKNYPKLPKFVQMQNFEIPPKFEIFVIFKNKIFYMLRH